MASLPVAAVSVAVPLATYLRLALCLLPVFLRLVRFWIQLLLRPLVFMVFTSSVGSGALAPTFRLLLLHL